MLSLLLPLVWCSNAHAVWWHDHEAAAVLAVTFELADKGGAMARMMARGVLASSWRNGRVRVVAHVAMVATATEGFCRVWYSSVQRSTIDPRLYRGIDMIGGGNLKRYYNIIIIVTQLVLWWWAYGKVTSRTNQCFINSSVIKTEILIIMKVAVRFTRD